MNRASGRAFVEEGRGVPLADEVRRVARVVLSVVVLSILASLAGWGLTVNLRAQAASLRETQHANQALVRDLLVSQAAMRGYLASGDPQLLSGAASGDEMRREAEGVASAVGDIAPGPAHEQQQSVSDWLDFRDSMVAERRAGRQPGSRLSTSPFPRVERANDAVDAALAARVADRTRLVGWSLAGSCVLVTAALLGLATVLLRLRRDLTQHVVHPLEELARTVATGEGGRAPTHTGPAEIRELSRVVNDYVEAAERSESQRLVEARVSRAKGAAALSIRRSLSEEAVLRALEDGLGDGMAASHVVVLRHDPDNPLWRTVVARTGTERRVLEVSTDRPLPEDLRECARIVGDPSWLASVVRADGRPAAVVVVTSREPRTWAPAEKDLLEQVCEYATRGIDQSRFEAERAEQLTRLEALDRQKTDFMATVSHELRTPLTSIAGYLEMVEDGDFGPLPEDAVPVVGILQRNTARLRALIEDLLVLSRIEASGVDLDVTPVELQVLVDQVVENLRPQATTGEVSLLQAERADGLVVEGDHAQLERALTNVIGNAVKFTPRGGSVRVDVHAHDDDVEVAVQDTGIGIPADDLQDVGRRFFRARNVTSQTIPGTGLGLSIVQAIAEAHRGEMRLDSVVGEGTCVTLRVARAARRGAAGG